MYSTRDVTEEFPFNGSWLVQDPSHSNKEFEQFPELPDVGGNRFNCYGVVDNPAQFEAKFGQTLKDDLRTFVVCFTHVKKDPDNAGQGGGWRWHKWGPYEGDGTPTREYLDDEQGFLDGVWTYEVLQVKGPNLNALRRWCPYNRNNPA